MLIKGQRCEFSLTPDNYPGLRFDDSSEKRISEGGDRSFKVPTVTNTAGRSNRITAAQADAVFGAQ